MSRPISVVFEGNETDAVRAFDRVGAASRGMSSKVDESTGAQTRLGERVGANEQRFMGTADILDGLGASFGLPTQGATALFRGFADLSGGIEIVSGFLPTITGMFPRLAGAMTFVSAHPLIMGILAGGAIIAGLILLEKKFGLVSGAVEGIGNAFQWAWNNAIKPALNFMLGGIELWLNAITTPLRLLSRIVPGIPTLPEVRLPRLDVGGTVLQTGIAVVHRGEVVSPAGASSFGSGGGTTNIYVAGSVVTERELVDIVHGGLLKKQGRTGNLGIKAA